MRCSKCGLIYDDTYGSNTCSCGGEIVSDRDYRALRNTINVSEETERSVSEEPTQPNSKKDNKKAIALVVSIAVLIVVLVSGILQWQSSFIVIPDVTNQDREAAVQAIVAAGFDKESVEITKEYNDNVKKGYVIQQNKTGKAHRSSIITLTISQGPDIVVVPDMTNWDEETVKTESNGKFKCEFGKSVYSSIIEEGHVAKQSIKAGKKVPRNELITVYLSKGPEMVTVPNLVGKTKEQAEELLEKVGLKLGETNEEPVSSKSNDRIVVGQNYDGTVVKGSEIDLTIGKYEAPTTTSPSTMNPPSNSSGSNTESWIDSTTSGTEQPMNDTSEDKGQQDNGFDTGWKESVDSDGDWEES